MPSLRFPNPGSDFEKVVRTFQLVARAFKDGVRFDLDDAVRVLIEHNQVSSSGAIGQEALRRSTRQDRSRDPLYNQLKMYSEIYRMLGWMHPVGKKLEFAITPLGEYIADNFGTADPVVRGLVRECLISITFPNPNTTGRGVGSIRPFLQLLRFLDALGGFATRDEMILGIYLLQDDTVTGAVEARVRLIEGLRGASADRVRGAIVGAAGGVQLNTLQNYTRFPLGAFKAPLIDWAQPETIDGVYEEPQHFYRLTANGRSFLRSHLSLGDVRADQLSGFSQEERANFLVLAHYVMYGRAGLDLAASGVDLGPYAEGSRAILDALGVADPCDIFFSPWQQAEHDDIQRAVRLP